MVALPSQLQAAVWPNSKPPSSRRLSFHEGSWHHGTTEDPPGRVHLLSQPRIRPELPAGRRALQGDEEGRGDGRRTGTLAGTGGGARAEGPSGRDREGSREPRADERPA